MGVPRGTSGYPEVLLLQPIVTTAGDKRDGMSRVADKRDNRTIADMLAIPNDALNNSDVNGEEKANVVNETMLTEDVEDGDGILLAGTIFSDSKARGEAIVMTTQ